MTYEFIIAKLLKQSYPDAKEGDIITYDDIEWIFTKGYWGIYLDEI